MKIRRLLQSDLEDVYRIQCESYNENILESVDSFSAKLSADSDFSFIAKQSELVIGYVVALPWVFGEILDLNGAEYSVSSDADSLCIHDIAVSSTARNFGAASHLLDAVLEAAKMKGYKRLFLIAIQGASPYWKRHGFEVVPVNEKVRHQLSNYGDGATYMARVCKDE